MYSEQHIRTSVLEQFTRTLLDKILNDYLEQFERQFYAYEIRLKKWTFDDSNWEFNLMVNMVDYQWLKKNRKTVRSTEFWNQGLDQMIQVRTWLESKLLQF